MAIQKKITTYTTKSSKKSKGSSRFRRRTLRKFSGDRVFKMQRTQRLGTITLAAGYNDIQNIYAISGNPNPFTSFNIDLLPSRTEITNLFQQYRVKGLKFRVSPRFDNVEQISPTSIPKWYVVKDTDGTVETATEDAMMQQRVRILKGNRDIVLYCAYPKFRNMITNTATAGVGFNAVNKWITSADPDINHCSFALGAYVPVGSTNPFVYDVWITAYVHAKGLK